MYKRSTIVPNIILLIVLGLCGLAPYGAAQEAKDPAQNTANQLAWQRLNSIQTLGEMQLVKVGGKNVPLQLNSIKIKSALEKSGINEPVSIHFADLNGNLFSNLGSYKPDKIGVKRQASASTTPQSGQSHQPTIFSTMPLLIQVQSLSSAASGPRGVKMKPGTVIQSKLVFKNSMGAIKATLQVQISIPDSKTSKKGKKSQQE